MLRINYPIIRFLLGALALTAFSVSKATAQGSAVTGVPLRIWAKGKSDSLAGTYENYPYRSYTFRNSANPSTNYVSGPDGQFYTDWYIGNQSSLANHPILASYANYENWAWGTSEYAASGIYPAYDTNGFEAHHPNLWTFLASKYWSASSTQQYVFKSYSSYRRQIYGSLSISGQFPLSEANGSSGSGTVTAPNQEFTINPMGPGGVVRAEVGKTYTISASALHLVAGELNVAAPPQYRVIINGVERNRSGLAPTLTVSIEPRSRAAAGAGGFASSLSADKLDWKVALGSLRNGDDAGALWLVDAGTGSDWTHLFTPAALNCNPTSDEVYVHRENNRIRQVIANQVAIDVSIPAGAADTYVIKCYSTTQLANTVPPCTFVGLPFVTYTVKKSDDAGDPATALKIIREYRNITDPTSLVTPVSRTESTKLVRTGTSPDFTWTRTDWYSGTVPQQETVATFSTTGATRTETIALRAPGAATAALAATRVYATFGFGTELQSESVGTAEARSVTFNYHEDTGQPGSLGYAKSVQLPGGGWEAYDYYASDASMSYQGGRVKNRYRPFGDGASATPALNSAIGEVTYYEYGPDPFGVQSRPTLIKTTINGIETARTTISYDSTTSPVVTSTRSDYASATVPLTTVTQYYNENTADAFLRGKPVSIRKPDGVTSLFTYEKGVWNGTVFTPNTSPNTATRISVATVPSGGTPLDRVSTKEVTIRDARALVVRSETYVSHNSGWQLVKWSNLEYNAAGLLVGRLGSDGATYTASWDGAFKVSETDESGVTTVYAPDASGRAATATRALATADGHTIPGVVTFFTYDAAGRVRQKRVGPEWSEHLLSETLYDDAGRVVSETAPGRGATTYSYQIAQRRQTQQQPDGSTVIHTTHVDGSPASKTGTGVVAEYYSQGVETDGRRWSRVDVAQANSARWTKTWKDWLGRKTLSQKPGFGGLGTIDEQSYYDAQTTNNTGRLVKNTKTGMAPTLFEYNSLSQLVRSGLDVDLSGTLVPASTDRISDSGETFELVGGEWWQTKIESHYPYEGSSAATVAQVAKTSTRLTGLGGWSANGQLRSEVRSWDIFGNESRRTVEFHPATKVATIRTTREGTPLVAVEKQLVGQVVSVRSTSGLETLRGYDALGRPSTVTDPRTGTTVTTYHPNTTLVLEVKDSLQKRLAYTIYDTFGRPVYQETAHPTSGSAAGFTTRTGYTLRGEVALQWGSGTYPISYEYNAYGERTLMRTYRDPADAALADSTTFPSLGTGDATAWDFDAATGLLKQKTDAKNKSVEYDYDAAGRMHHRYWARVLPGTTTRVTTTYGYHAATGEQTAVTYNDGTPALTFAYNRLGQTAGVIQAYVDDPLDTLFDHCRCGKVTAEYFDASFFGQRTLTHTLDTTTVGQKGRTTGYLLTVGSTVEQAVNYGFDAATSRLANLTTQPGASSAGARTFAYAYLAGSDLVQSLSIAGNHPYTLTRTHEPNRDLLTQIEARWGSNPGNSRTRYSYTYDNLRRRANVVQAGDVFADYGGPSAGAIHQNFAYNGRSELVQAASWLGDLAAGEPDTSYMSARNHEFGYDGIGNRRWSNTGGVAGTRDYYRTNELNQYTAKENNTLAVGGTVAADSSIKVVAGTHAVAQAGRHGRHWGDNALVDNLNGPYVGSFKTFAAKVGGGTAGADLLKSVDRSVVVPKAWQTFEYDADGNVITDGLWRYSWDAENRLIAMETMVELLTTGAVPAAEGRRLEFRYDYLGRRVQKLVRAGWNGSTFATMLDQRRFVYQGWNLIAEFTVNISLSTLNLARSYTWGLDIVHDFVRSGGVGALVQIRDHALGKEFVPSYDGNGNVAALFDADAGLGGACVAAYEYSPYGEPLRVEGTYAKENPFRFSTKFTDEETGLIYFGLRYYDRWRGRFLGRDPKEEAGGINLYAYVHNGPVNRWDYLGLCGGNSNEYVNETGVDSYGGEIDGESDPNQDLMDSFARSSEIQAAVIEDRLRANALAAAANSAVAKAGSGSAQAGYWSQVVSYFGNYLRGVAESPVVIAQAVARGYSEIGGLAADATTRQFWSDLATMTGNPLGTASAVISVGGDLVTGTIASFEDGRNLGHVIGGGALGSWALPTSLGTLSNASKGAIGEATSLVTNVARGNLPAGGYGVGWQVTLDVAGRAPRIDWQFRNVFTGNMTLVESKFGTAGLTSAQRAAASIITVEKWTYQFWGNVGASGGAAAGAAGGGCK